MMSRKSAIFGLTLLPFALLLSTPTLAYDASWFKTDFWAGEYPHGFTLKEDVSVQIRAKPDPGAPGTIECALKKGATYHPWNEARVKASRLDFISYVPIMTFKIVTPVTITLRDEKTDAKVKRVFARGDEWTYLTYYAEGMFKMRFKGTLYTSEQDLIEASKEKVSTPSQGARDDDEWLKLTCANGADGWLLLEEVTDLPAFDAPQILGYGNAADVK